MEKTKLDKVIEAFRNVKELKEMMVANAPGTGGGFSASSPDEGPVAGKTPKMFLLGRKFVKKYAKGGHGSRKKWLDNLKDK